jgi:hypothetical protein
MVWWRLNRSDRTWASGAHPQRWDPSGPTHAGWHIHDPNLGQVCIGPDSTSVLPRPPNHLGGPSHQWHTSHSSPSKKTFSQILSGGSRSASDGCRRHYRCCAYRRQCPEEITEGEEDGEGHDVGRAQDRVEEARMSARRHQKSQARCSPRPGAVVTRVNSTNVLDDGLRIGEIGRRINSEVRLVKISVYQK